MDTRQSALRILEKTLYQAENLDEAFERTADMYSSQDKNFIRMLSTTTLRHLGQIDFILNKLIVREMPHKARVVRDILRLGFCQVFFMNVAEHAAVSTSVDLVRLEKQDFYTKLVNGVLRNACRQKESLLLLLKPQQNVPDWLYQMWKKDYGEVSAVQIAESLLCEPACHITVKSNPQLWAEKLNGVVVGESSVALPSGVYIPSLEGFDSGQWWVQDRGAALAVEALGSVQGLKVADVCAAPGGKTAYLCARGAVVDAYDISSKRLTRVAENLKRLHLSANLIALDAHKIKGEELYDALLLDAPCSATGTIRRHPDLYAHRQPQDVEKLHRAQVRLLKTAHRLVKKGGYMVYCTCSLQKREGEDTLSDVADLWEVEPIKITPEFQTKQGCLRTFPMQGVDGFFVARLRKKDTQ